VEDKQVGITDINKALFRVSKTDKSFIAEENSLIVFHCFEHMQQFFPVEQGAGRVVGITDESYISFLLICSAFSTGKPGGEFIFAKSRGLDKKNDEFPWYGRA